MDLQETLKAISVAAIDFNNGTRITTPAEGEAAVSVAFILLDNVRKARLLGATGYEIERAMAGEIIGSSFLEECTAEE